ncbi:MAG: cell division protein FtsI (penicillin-binding protein 3), partial [Flavobacterium sp.]
MAVEEKKKSYRVFVVALLLCFMAIAITIKLSNIIWIEGDYYRKLAKDRTVKTFVIPANKGNIYSADGSLLATSIPNYTIRFDALAPNAKDFEGNIQALSDSLATIFDKTPSYYQEELRLAKANKNRYLLLGKNLSYTDYVRFKTFPLFNKGTNKGGLIIEQETVREHPIGKIAERTIGYERKD